MLETQRQTRTSALEIPFTKKLTDPVGAAAGGAGGAVTVRAAVKITL